MNRSRREVWLFLTPTIAMALMGVVLILFAEFMQSGLTGLINERVVGWSVIYFFLGSIVGFFSTVIVVPCLQEKNLKFAIPFVYVPSCAVIVFGLMFWHSAISRRIEHPTGIELLALALVCGLSVVAKHLLPTASEMMQGRCAHCGYDLRGNRRAGCPECGWNRQDR